MLAVPVAFLALITSTAKTSFINNTLLIKDTSFRQNSGEHGNIYLKTITENLHIFSLNCLKQFQSTLFHFQETIIGDALTAKTLLRQLV